MRYFPGYTYALMAILSQAPRLIFFAITSRQPTFQEAIALLIMVLPLAIALLFFTYRRPAAAKTRNDAAGDRRSELSAARRRLVILLHGDIAAADRLLQAAYQRYPDRPAAWIYDKVIQDLIQDRMR
ncbi:hypothetical protein P7L53_12110 [Thermoleptolyngbya sichuanensis XZ-Cy5]|uniref:hypothetical protein n=1 Tax=Thermoleptolyngbya sichuanensis TaxID=2885951 RepID=UPI00240DC82E|nr:hypothetical protein [Thermoleptolyngbya sichuanensis]MDG2616984.1 hypothetical protein [Thermoleptolyngbya sichuanensis XZ-Cy5]